jgi:hypothetical protein
MVGFLTGILVLLICVYMIIQIAKACPECTEEVEEIIQRPHVHNAPDIAGNVKRELDTASGQAFVTDPVDQKKCWLNTNDDMYEAADGKIYRVVA